MKDKLDDPVVNQGYTPHSVGRAENARNMFSHNESYEHRRFKNEKCPSDEELQGFRATMDEFYQVRESVP